VITCNRKQCHYSDGRICKMMTLNEVGYNSATSTFLSMVGLALKSSHTFSLRMSYAFHLHVALWGSGWELVLSTPSMSGVVHVTEWVCAHKTRPCTCHNKCGLLKIPEMSESDEKWPKLWSLRWQWRRLYMIERFSKRIMVKQYITNQHFLVVCWFVCSVVRSFTYQDKSNRFLLISIPVSFM
jgi:hypothetical protein